MENTYDRNLHIGYHRAGDVHGAWCMPIYFRCSKLAMRSALSAPAVNPPLGPRDFQRAVSNECDEIDIGHSLHKAICATKGN
jgi:hypothetical protein